MFHFAGADAERQCAEGSVGRGVRVAADDSHAGLGCAQLWPDHVDDALRGILHIEEFDAELGAVGAQRIHLRGGDLIDDVEAVLCAGRGDVVVYRSDVTIRAANLPAAMRRPSKACGLVTSWTRCRSM